MNRGDVWWASFDPAVDSEIRKTRPAVIVSNNAANKHLPRVVVVPVTSNVARLYPGEATVSVEGKPAKAMANQLTTIDKSRMKSQLDVLSKTDMQKVEHAIKVHLALPL